MDMQVPALRPDRALTAPIARAPGSLTRATTDRQIITSWITSKRSPHTRRAFSIAADRFTDAMDELSLELRSMTVEDLADVFSKMAETTTEKAARAYALRIKSLLTYCAKVGFTSHNLGVTLTIKPDPSNLAQRIMAESEVWKLISSARTQRDRLVLSTLYLSGMRCSELVTLSWCDVTERDGGRLQLSVLGKGDKRREVLLPADISALILQTRNGADDDAPVFRNRAGKRYSSRGINHIVTRARNRAGMSKKVSPHWLRHAHGSHAIDRGATLPEVQSTLGHASISTTSGYLHARPDSSSGLKLESVAGLV